MERKHRFQCPEVEEAATLILEKFASSNAFLFPFRFALAIGQRVCFRTVPLTPPSLDIGVNDGSTASIIHYGKPSFTWGGDMPEESTYESMGLYVSPEYNVYDNLIGLDASSAVPFPPGSFNTISATEVFAYGIDRDATMAELSRILAPGGTLAFSESSEGILEYPALQESLRKYVPALNILEDSRAYYHETLGALGMTDIVRRLYLRRPLAALLHALMYSADPAADHERHRRLIVEDAQVRRVYTEGLLAIAAAMDDEFAGGGNHADGWHIFVSCRKPGQLDPNIPPPTPWCPVCHSLNLMTSLTDCRCDGCGRTYMIRFGIPYLLRDSTASYSPKSDRPPHLKSPVPLDRTIDGVLMASYPILRASSAQPRVRLFGVDPSTAFTIRHLRESGIEVSCVGTGSKRLVGLTIEGIQIRSTEEFTRSNEPLLLSAFPGAERDALDALGRAGFKGTAYSLGQGTATSGWQPMKMGAQRLGPFVVGAGRRPDRAQSGLTGWRRFAERVGRKLLRG